jgi:hypothetical protein
VTRLQGWTRWLLLVVSLVVAIGAIPVGVGFVIAPDGSRVGMPLDLLQGTPFASFRIPGLLLAVAVGGSTLTAAILLARRHRHALAASFLAGAIVVGWISVQVVLIGLASPLQPIVAALGLALILLAWPPASPTE